MHIIAETPESFWAGIPRTLAENLSYRSELHRILSPDKGAQRAFCEMCYARPQIAYDTMFWGYDPRKPPFERNVPYVLRPAQVEAVAALKCAIDGGTDLLFEKSRDEGATETIIKFYVLYFLITDSSRFLVGSRKEEYVDKNTEFRGTQVLGDHKCLFYKILYTIATLPIWLRPQVEKQKNHVINLGNGSTIDGESTNESFGAGDRCLSVMIDEFGRIDSKVAQSIRETLSDTTNCVIYNSTHFYGRGHPFARLCTSGKVRVVKLPWWRNPVKAAGLYRSFDLNKVEIKDLDYYLKRFPAVFKSRVLSSDSCVYSELERDMVISYSQSGFGMVADGSGKLRSPWYDYECRRRDDRDVAQNIDMNPIGAGDMFFDPDVIQQHRQRFARVPDYMGEVVYGTHKRYGLSGIRFVPDGGKKRLRWWGGLLGNRPLQRHNYIVACDVAMGTGASNSVAKVYDVNRSALVGSFVSPFIAPEEFAEYVVAMCRWVGGSSGRPYLIWEGTGPGQAFEQRILQLGYEFHYHEMDERAEVRKKKRRRGWFSNRELKYDLLLGLRAALANGLKKDMRPALAVPDEDTLREYEDYLFLENGDIGSSMSCDDVGGAKQAHGDRVITDGLYALALRYQPKALVLEAENYNVQSLAYRWAQSEHEKKESNSPWLLAEN